MFKQSPSRNHRSKGLKVKHVLQLCVLLAVCVWLIYQVKHSHEKRREFETKDENVAGKVQINGEILRFGRKDIPRITEIVTDGEKHEEEDEEKEGEEEENKHEDDELEREDVRLVETEEERGDGDDEIDEHESEKTETETEHEEEEEEVDEEKEREEREGATEENHTDNEENQGTNEGGHAEEEDNEDAEKEGHSETGEIEDVDKEDHGEREVDSDDQEHVAERINTREAQEVLYQADDASSEVAHDVQSISESENVTNYHSNEIREKVNFGQERKTKTFDKADNLTKPEVQPRDVENGASNATISSNPRSTRGTVVADELIKPEVKLSKPGNAEDLIKSNINSTNFNDVDSSLQNSTLPETTSNSSVAVGKHSAILNSYGTETSLVGSHLSRNGTIELPGDEKPKLPDNSTAKFEQAADDKKLQEAAANANKAENVNTNTNNKTLASSDGTNDDDAIEAAKDSLVDNENKSDKAGSENQHDPIDASDTSTLTQEETEPRTDSDTLPEIRTEVRKTEDTVVE